MSTIFDHHPLASIEQRTLQGPVKVQDQRRTDTAGTGSTPRWAAGGHDAVRVHLRGHRGGQALRGHLRRRRAPRDHGDPRNISRHRTRPSTGSSPRWPGPRPREARRRPHRSNCRARRRPPPDVDLGEPGGPAYTRAMLSKRAWWPMKARRVRPVGPLRCLATMISAVPWVSVDSGL